MGDWTGTGQPADPMTPMLVAATSVHELFTAYMTAGFTRVEALAIICTLLSKPATQT